MSVFLSTVRRLTYLLGCLVVALAFAALPTQAESTAIGAQTVVLTASQDATIDSLTSLDNFGGKPDLRVVFGIDSASGSRFQQGALLQFDLSSIPPGSTITSAKLGMNLATASESTLVAGYRVTSAWNEASVTYKDRPATDTSPLFVQDVPPDPTPRQVTFDVTALASSWVNQPTSNFGLLLRPTATSSVQRIFDSREGPRGPVLTVEYTLPPIRVCRDSADPCTPLDGAAVFDLTQGQAQFTTASAGLVQDKATIRLGDQLWVKHLVEPIRNDLGQYCTTAQPVPVTAANFHNYPNAGSELRLVVDCRQPVMLQDLVISTWYMEDDPARKEWLAANVIQASDYLFDFSEGRVALGKVVVRQNYVGWAAANIKLHTSNTLHPNANIGGIVPGETPDFSPTIAISYTPGSIFMGSYWNRFGTPPDQVNIYKGAVVPQATLASDWAIALAHELSHYLFFLFDTYTDKEGHSNEAIAAQCTGSAMGNAYEPVNHAFVLNQGHWDTACSATEAHARLLGRTEWATITGWYPWLTAPAAIVIGERPSGPLTQVIFEPVPPNSAPAPLAASQIFSLTYQAGEQSSGEARAFLLRADSRLFDQGKPAKNATTVQLTDARLGDRLCVFDLNDNAEGGETPRHQFGCEVIVAGDAELVMTRNTAWKPLVTIQQTGPQQLSVSVVQALPAGTAIFARLIPEDGNAYAPQALVAAGDVWSTVFNLPAPVSPLFLQLWVDETPLAPTTRREVVADRGAGGNGAFGPAKLHTGVLVVSSDGKASYEGEEGALVDLGVGESIAWQSMPGTPPLPPGRFIAGQSYRLDAYPPALVAGGTASIQFENTFGALQAAGADGGPAIHFWDGTSWAELPTSIVTPAAAADNIYLASAPGQGVGVYAVLSDLAGRPTTVYLPLIAR